MGGKPLEAEPYPIKIDLSSTALLIIDMQNDYCSKGGWADLAGHDIQRAASVLPRIQDVLTAAREVGLFTIYTRKGYRPDLSDCAESKQRKMQHTGFEYGQEGPRGRLFIRGTWNNEIVDELMPLSNEVVIDKSGQGAFYATDLDWILRNRGITTLVLGGVTTHICVQSTIRDAADRGFDAILLADCCQAYEEKLHREALDILRLPSAIFGWLSSSEAFIDLLKPD
jgi:nicotinamidase-related amidase